MIKLRYFGFIGLILMLWGCPGNSKKQQTDPAQTKTTAPESEMTLTLEENQGKELLEKCILAHGGMDTWKSFEALEYQLDNNGQNIYEITHLKDRRSYIKSEDYEVGFDGELVWALPDASQVPGNSAAFYYNLDFYFIGIPFLLKDPGVHPSYVGEVQIANEMYECLKITFGSGVGISPKDVYFLYIDPDTYLLEILTYSVSYFNSENAPVSTAKRYSDYRKVQGLQMPHKMENFEWKDGTIGQSKHHLRLFSEIKFLQEMTNEALFKVPEGAITESLSN